VVQRVSMGSVSIDGAILNRIGPGLLVLLAIGKQDQEADLDWMVEKVLHLRCFDDDQGKMNRSVQDHRGEILCISQFTLYGDCQRGNRPSFDKAAATPLAFDLYQKFIDKVAEKGIIIKAGKFGARMTVSLVNEGPVTLILDSKS